MSAADMLTRYWEQMPVKRMIIVRVMPVLVKNIAVRELSAWNRGWPSRTDANCDWDAKKGPWPQKPRTGVELTFRLNVVAQTPR